MAEHEMGFVDGAIDTVLGEVHRKNGAHMGVWFGCGLPDSFGNWEEEYRLLRDKVGLVDKNYRAYLEFTGPDQLRYLNAILTNDIKGLQENHGTVSLLLNPQGHIQAELETYVVADMLFCVSYAVIRERLVPLMDKYIIMDDVTLTDATDKYATLAVEGSAAPDAVFAASGVELAAMDQLESQEAKVGEIPCRVIKKLPGGIASAEFLVARERAEGLWNTLYATVRRIGGGPVGYKALNALRLETNVPWFGYDFGDKQIPPEAGLQDSHISYTKGCYTGQEIVERVRSRGQVNRVRVSLRFDGTEGPAPETPLLADEKEIGHITRTGFSPLLKAWIGMGYVRREQGKLGTKLNLPEGSATVIASPV
jgi:folate-binding protein YgfZ